MSWASEHLWGKTKNPADSAMKYLDQIPGATQPYYQPFIDQGQQAGNKLNSQYDQMTTSPGEFFNNMSAGYKESPGYQLKLKNALAAANNAQAAGGMLGTPQHQEVNMDTAQGVASKDYEDYIGHIMSLFGMGQQGQQKFQEQGFDASKDYGSMMGDVLGQKAQYGFAGQAGMNQNKSNNMKNLMNGLAMLFSKTGMPGMPGPNVIGS